MRTTFSVVAFLCLAINCLSQVPVAISPVAKQQFGDVNGNPLTGGLLYTYSSGTSTPLSTYTDSTGTSQNTNPIVLDSGGFTPQGLFLSANSYKFVLKDVNGVTQWTIDGINQASLLLGAVLLNPPGNASQTIAGPINLGTYGLTAATGTLTRANITKLNYVGVLRDCRIDGVVADGTTNDGPAINTCFANAVSGGYGGIQLPAGKIKASTALNFTNTQGLNIRGATSTFGGFGELTSFTTGTEILCNTGTVCADFTGSSWIRVSDLEFRTTNLYSTPSTVGLLFGRDNAAGGGSGTYCFSQFNVLNNVVVYMEPNAAVTAKGRVALYNVGAEHFTIHGGLYRGDVGGYWTIDNVLSITSPYQTLQTGCPTSMSIVQVDSAASFQAAGSTASNPAIELQGSQILDFDFINIHAINSNAGSGVAFNFNGPGGSLMQNIRITGQFESFPALFNSNGDLDSININVLGVSPTVPLFTLGANINITNSTFKMPQTGTPQVMFSTGSGNTCKNCTLYDGAKLGGNGLNSTGLTLTQSVVFDQGRTASPTLNSASSYQLFNDAGNFFISNLSAGAVSQPNTILNVTSDFILAANTNLQTITGLTFTLPANLALKVPFSCHLLYVQNTAAVADQFGIQAATIAPTQITANAKIYISTSTLTQGVLTGLTTTTATPIVTFTPSTFGQALAADIDGFIENPSNASPNVINIMAQTSDAADTVTVKRGSFCKVF